jgi:hypothetical protein
MKVYRGFRKDSKFCVTVQQGLESEPELLRHYVKHTPMGFSWGGGSSGSSDLAWSLLIDLLGPNTVDFVEFIYQKFKKEIVFNLDEEWTLTGDMIQESIQDYKKIFDAEFEKSVSITSKVDPNLTLSATGNMEMLIRLGDEIKSLAAQANADLAGNYLGKLYYEILIYCETIKEDLSTKINC